MPVKVGEFWLFSRGERKFWRWRLLFAKSCDFRPDFKRLDISEFLSYSLRKNSGKSSSVKFSKNYPEKYFRPVRPEISTKTSKFGQKTQIFSRQSCTGKSDALTCYLATESESRVSGGSNPGFETLIRRLDQNLMIPEKNILAKFGPYSSSISHVLLLLSRLTMGKVTSTS